MSAVDPSWEETHARYTARGLVDATAPVQASGLMPILATPARVWEVLTGVAGWPYVRSDIHDVKVSGSANPGASFTWWTGEVQLRSTFGVVNAPREVTWSTTTSGLVMTHLYRIEPIGKRFAELSCHEAMTAPAAPQIDSAELGSRIQSWLKGIRSAAEGRG